MSKSKVMLEGLSAVNFGSGLVGALVGKLLTDVGIKVFRPISPRGDPASAFYPAYEALRSREEAFAYRESSQDVLPRVDICIVGGEDFPNSVRETPDAASLAAKYPQLIVLDIQSHPLDRRDAPRPAVDILIQARSGLVYEHYSNRPNLMAFQPSHYGAAFQGVIGALAALYARGCDGAGQLVSTSLYEGALSWVMTWNEAERADTRFRFTVPLDPRPLIMRCADGRYVQVIMGSVGAKYELYRILGIDDPSVKPGDPGLPNMNDPPEKFYGDLDLLAPYVARWNSEEFCDALGKAKVAASIIQNPGSVWDDPQIAHNGLIAQADDGTQFVGSPIRATITEERAHRPLPQPSADAPLLSGLRVIDFGAFTAGPLMSRFLKDLGADVIKVEPIAGDPARNMIRAFIASNHGKQSIAIDMKSPEGAEIVQKLCASADIITSNFRPGVSTKLGIDAATLTKRNPHLIVLESPAFGQTGPRAMNVAFDLVMQALCGFEVRAGGLGNTPLWNRCFIADYAGGQIGAVALLAALCARQRTGRGASIETSLLDAAFFTQSETIRKPDGTFAGADLLNAEQTGFHPAECLYKARDGWVAIAVRSTQMADAFLHLLGVSGTVSGNWQSWGPKDQTVFERAIASWDIDALMNALDKAGVWAERCQPGREHATLNDADLIELGTVEYVAHEKYGRMSQIGPLFRLSRSAVSSPAPAPTLGSHTSEILRSIGYSQTAMAELLSSKVVA